MQSLKRMWCLGSPVTRAKTFFELLWKFLGKKDKNPNYETNSRSTSVPQCCTSNTENLDWLLWSTLLMKHTTRRGSGYPVNWFWITSYNYWGHVWKLLPVIMNRHRGEKKIPYMHFSWPSNRPDTSNGWLPLANNHSDHSSFYCSKKPGSNMPDLTMHLASLQH